MSNLTKDRIVTALMLFALVVLMYLDDTLVSTAQFDEIPEFRGKRTSAGPSYLFTVATAIGFLGSLAGGITRCFRWHRSRAVLIVAAVGALIGYAGYENYADTNLMAATKTVWIFLMGWLIATPIPRVDASESGPVSRFSRWLSRKLEQLVNWLTPLKRWIIAIAVGGLSIFVTVYLSDTSLDKNVDVVSLRGLLEQEINETYERKVQTFQDSASIHELGRLRDRMIASTDELIVFIDKGFVDDPIPVFDKSLHILREKGIEAALAYLETNNEKQWERVEIAAARIDAARELLAREVRPLLFEAELHKTQLEWEQALTLLEKVVNVAPQSFEARNRLGRLLHVVNRYEDAELHLREAVLLATTPVERASALSSLGLLLHSTNKLVEAERYAREALAIFENELGEAQSDDVRPYIAVQQNNLASLLLELDRRKDAETLLRRALATDEAEFGDNHPNVAVRLNNLAALLLLTDNLVEAEEHLRRALAINKDWFGPDHPAVAHTQTNLGFLLHSIENFEEAERLMRSAMNININRFGEEHTLIAIDLSNLALLLVDTRRFNEAEAHLRRALKINEDRLGSHPSVATNLSNLAEILIITDRIGDAEKYLRRALDIDIVYYGREHSEVAADLDNLAQLLLLTNRPNEAEQLTRQALEIYVATVGEDHPAVAIQLANLANILQETNALAEAERLARRALQIHLDSYGPYHTNVAIDLHILAQVLRRTGRFDEAELLWRRSALILLCFESRTGYEHLFMKSVMQGYESLLADTGRSESESQIQIDSLLECIRLES